MAFFLFIVLSYQDMIFVLSLILYFLFFAFFHCLLHALFTIFRFPLNCPACQSPIFQSIPHRLLSHLISPRILPSIASLISPNLPLLSSPSHPPLATAFHSRQRPPPPPPSAVLPSLLITSPYFLPINLSSAATAPAALGCPICSPKSCQ